MNSQTEVCLNIWFIIDSDTELIYRMAARAYALSGTDDDKARVLKSLSMSDFHLSKHFSLSKYRAAVNGPVALEGTVGGFFPNSLDDFLPDILESVCTGIEADFIAQPIITPSGGKTYKMKIPSNPYYVITFLFENDQGVLSPRIG